MATIAFYLSILCLCHSYASASHMHARILIGKFAKAEPNILRCFLVFFFWGERIIWQSINHGNHSEHIDVCIHWHYYSISIVNCLVKLLFFVLLVNVPSVPPQRTPQHYFAGFFSYRSKNNTFSTHLHTDKMKLVWFFSICAHTWNTASERTENEWSERERERNSFYDKH